MAAMSTVLNTPQSLPDRFRAGLQDLRTLVRSPQLLGCALKCRWQIPTLLLLSLLLVPAVLQPLANVVLEEIYPPVARQHLFGLLNTTHQDKRLDTRKTQAAWLLWLLACAGAGAGLVLYAPTLRTVGEDELERRGDTPDVSDAGQPPELEKRYRIDAELGAGAMGVVFSAFDRKLERQVALKELPPAFVRDPARRERFRREALSLARLTHPGVVQIYDLFDDGRRMLLVMEQVDGGTLEQLIVQRAPLPVAEAARLILAIVDALDQVHRQGIVHRDLKPANILLDTRGAPKVTDFGLARLLENGELTLDGSLLGSPNYMSPEQATSQPIDARADYYALGAVFYELLTGTPPFSGIPTEVLLQQASTPPPPLTERLDACDPELEALVATLLDKDPDQRLTDPAVLRGRLQSVIDRA